MDFSEIQKKDEVLDYLSSEKAAVLSMHAIDGTIDAATVFFANDEDFIFYFTTKVNTRKYRNLVANSEVTLTISNVEELKTVEVKGNASLITDSEEIGARIITLNEKNRQEGLPWAPPIAFLDAGQYVIIRVIPTWIRYGVFLNEEPRGEYFTQII
jgi:hypothetical protein